MSKQKAYGSRVIVLTCKHVLEFMEHVPQKGDEFWCSRCQEMRTVSYMPKAVELRMVRCRSCQYSRRFGVARLAAERAYAKHAQSKPHHRVQLLDGSGELLHESTNGRQVTVVELPFDPDTLIPVETDPDQPPF